MDVFFWFPLFMIACLAMYLPYIIIGIIVLVAGFYLWIFIAGKISDKKNLEYYKSTHGGLDPEEVERRRAIVNAKIKAKQEAEADEKWSKIF